MNNEANKVENRKEHIWETRVDVLQTPVHFSILVLYIRCWSSSYILEHEEYLNFNLLSSYINTNLIYFP